MLHSAIGTAPIAVQFTGLSTNTPTSWSWAFGDGGMSTQQNLSHTYSSAVAYNFSLIAVNAGGSNMTVNQNFISVTSPVVCDSTGPYVDFVIENVSFGEECTPEAWQKAVCYDNALIRYAIAGKSTQYYATLSQWKWKQNFACPDPGHSYAVEQPYGKEIYIAGVKKIPIWDGITLLMPNF